ncbi:hypothetical protein TNCV_2139271 [Trichonephila clavipes]|uniref:Uncharacterized protein n=1 Tax=Trichonephila clavipes TaxID=2585209 RepID=A0A8X6VBY3_TRICX|nr:hypothetical protein TNCV_2139271 [Trichonephila clavipes]
MFSSVQEVCGRPERLSSSTLSLPFLKRRCHSKAVATVAKWSRYQIVAGIVTSSSPVPLKTRRVEQRYTLNLSRAEASSSWCGS